jgi:hypothetical protein
MVFKLRIAASLMALLFAILPFVSFTGIVATKVHVKHQLFSHKKHFHKKDLDTLILDASQYGYLKAGSEFELNNAKYDVVSAVIKGKSVLLLVFNDTKEKAFEKLAGLDKESKNKSSKTGVKLPDWNCSQEADGYCLFEEKRKQKIPKWEYKIDAIYLIVDVPPPEV